MCTDLETEEKSTPKKRMTARKKMFTALETEGTSRDSQGFCNEGTDPETVAGLQDVGDNRPEGLKGYDREIREVIADITKKASKHNIDMTLVEGIIFTLASGTWCSWLFHMLLLLSSLI